MGQVPFSPDLMKFYFLQQLWLLVWRKKFGHRISSTKIRRLSKKCALPLASQASLVEAEANYWAASLQYQQLKPMAAELQVDFLHRRSLEPHHSDQHLKAVANILCNERRRESYQVVRRLKGVAPMTSVSQVETPSPTGPVLHTSQAAVEQQIGSAFSRQFQGANGTPFLSPPLFHCVGLDGTSAAARSILAGTFVCPPEVDEYTQQFISCLRQPPDLPSPTPLSISALDFQTYWGKSRERTSSSYSGLHFGHYKAAATCPTLLEIHAIFIQLCFANGFSPLRWQSGLQVVLEKKAGIIHIDRLHALLLMEADFNFGNKILFGHRMMQQAMDSQAIPEECFGSVKGRCAIHVSLSSCLLADIAQQCRIPLALVHANVAGCYDNIAHFPGCIACQCLGASRDCLSTMFQTLQLMKFYLRTAYGDSSTTFPRHLPRQWCQSCSLAGSEYLSHLYAPHLWSYLHCLQCHHPCNLSTLQSSLC